jgi:hypothetical protein
MPSLEFPGGSAQFERVARAFREAEAGLPRELVQALEKSAKPLKRDAKASALTNLPHLNGLNRIVAAARMTVTPRANGIRIKAHGIDQLRLTNDGKIVHPTYGHRPRKVQRIPAAKDWFTKPMRDGEPKIRRELAKALNKIARRIA